MTKRKQKIPFTLKEYAAVVAILFQTCATGDEANIRHVVLISIDTLRADYLECYGNPSIRTPNINALAREGILFTHCVSAASSTLASHTSLMTGTYPHTHGVARNDYFVSEKNVMLAESLRSAGFLTAGFIGALPLDPEFGFGQGFDIYNAEYDFHVKGRGRDQYQRRAEAVTDAVLAWLDEELEEGDEGRVESKRIFLFVHYFDPHLPYDAPPPYEGMYRSPGSSFDHSMDAVLEARTLLRVAPEEIARELAKKYQAEYAAEITYCDHHIGRLLEGLKKHGFYDSSLIVLTADHGETINEHPNKLNHGMTVFETEIHVPLIMRLPGSRFGGRRVSRLVSHIDIVPTISELLGLEANRRVEGQSFVEAIAGEMEPRDAVFAEATQPWDIAKFDSDPLWVNRGKFQCIRRERHKFMVRPADGTVGFYDLEHDPFEQHNLLKDAHAPDQELVTSMRQELERWRDDAHPMDSKPVVSEQMKDALESLGYLRGQE